MSLYVKVRPVSGEDDTKVTHSMYCIYHTRLSPLHQIFLLQAISATPAVLTCVNDDPLG